MRPETITLPVPEAAYRILALFARDIDEAITVARADEDEQFCVNWGNLQCIDCSVSFHMPGGVVSNNPVLTAYIEEASCHLFERWVRDQVKGRWPNFHIDVKTEW